MEIAHSAGVMNVVAVSQIGAGKLVSQHASSPSHHARQDGCTGPNIETTCAANGDTSLVKIYNTYCMNGERLFMVSLWHTDEEMIICYTYREG